MADYPDDPDDLGDPDMVDDHDHPDLDEDATGGVSPDILLMGLIRAMAAKLQDEDDDDEDNRRRRRPSRRNQNDDDDDDVNRSVRLPPVVGKGKAASSSCASKMSYSTAARKQRPQLKQHLSRGPRSSSNTSQHKTPVSNADYEGGGGVTSLPMAAQRSQRAEVVKGKRGVGGGRPSTSSGSPVPAPAASTTSTCCDLLTREVLTTTEQVTKQLEKNQADRLKVAKERAQLLTSFQAVTTQFMEVAKQNLEGKGAGEVPKSTSTSTTSNPPSGN
ncbi:hypothetical protein TYRP_012677 [Tyrophagus putrescentiae]|nr:hypothetical protein TYRP_012677 [Tyrophagus putrescentiae]